MGSIVLFQFQSGNPVQLDDSTAQVEKDLQKMIERDLETYLGITFLASEFSTGNVHGGRIDTLGIDENNVPVIIEYKRGSGGGVINQGLYYLDWLLDHKGDFSELVRKVSGPERADHIDWASPRVLCIAGDFKKYDEHAVQQIGKSIELIQYRHYGDDLFLLERIGREPDVKSDESPGGSALGKKGHTDSLEYRLGKSSDSLRQVFDEVIAYLETFDDATSRENKLYIAFKRIKNFACVEVIPQNEVVSVLVKVDPDTIELEDGFTRDLRDVGKWGTGDLGISIRSREDLERAKPLIVQSYEES